MKNGNIPIRMCIACGKRAPKNELIRVVKSGKSSGVPTAMLPLGHCEGRSAYLCNDVRCFQKARKFRKLERAFSMKIDVQIYEQLEKAVCSSE